ncbi:MAG TPA: hypothetical protein VFK03_04815, partial [Candidatus Saccharimonadales bacterium]|nr:hypothetical protein [Candidatus Saccharimonadales bacterium]
MSDSRPAQHHTYIGRLIVSLVLLAAAGWLLLNRQAVLDHINAWAYQPSAQIQQIVKADTMTDQAKFYFYASRPEIDDRTDFNQACSSVGSEQTAVLGCYAGQKIYIFNVTSDQLDGIKQVTAAHEMLHAAYDRLSQSERQRVDKLVEAEAKNNHDPTVADLIKVYAKTEPGERLNELHSIFGSQVADLSPKLEQYYQRYFSDRGQVVELYQQYHSVFERIKAQQDQLVADLDRLAGEIKSLEADYNSAVAQLNRDIAAFNARASSGQMSRSEYNSQRATLKQRQASLKGQASLINQKI